MEFKKAMGTGKNAPTSNGVDLLGWDFAFEFNEVASEQAARANIEMQFMRIPRDVMDKRPSSRATSSSSSWRPWPWSPRPRAGRGVDA